MKDLLYQCFLLFSHDTFIIPLVVLGYIGGNRKVFSHAIQLILMSMLLNVALKVTFKVPLDAALSKDWFAFPSGHMQLAVVLYTWLFRSFSQPMLRVLCVCICIGIAKGLLHFGYHQVYDIIGAGIVGLLWVWVYDRLLTVSGISHYLPALLILFASFLMIYITKVYTLKGHAWMAYYALIGMNGGEYMFRRNSSGLSLKQKIFALLFFVIGFLVLHKLFLCKTLPCFLSQLYWLGVGGLIPGSVFLFQSKPSLTKNA